MIALLEARKAGLFSREHLFNNLLAGLVVGVVALPLAMAFAIASGAKPEQGLYTAVVAGFMTSVFGGGRLQISGPTGAFIAILAGITAKHGIAGLQVATLMAGLILIAMGVARFGSVIKYIPNPVITGFTAGIGLIIWVGQWKDFFGLKPVGGGEHFHQHLAHLIQAFPSLHLPTTGLALLSLAVLLLTPRLFKRIPAPLAALVVATGVQATFHFEGVATIGSAFGGIPDSLPGLTWPELSLSTVVKLIGPAFTIALLGAIESLLSAVVADGMAGTRHDSNQELIGQGIANVCAPLFGGFAATGAIARTATNIRAGATSPLAGITHSVVLLLIILILAPWASNIPLCALSAILFVVAYNMSELHHFGHLLRTASRQDVAILLITFSLTVLVDLVIAVNVGVALASLLFMSRMAQAVEVQEAAPTEDEDGGALRLPPRTQVYAIDGPFFFGAAEKLQRTLDSIQRHADTVVLRMARVPFIDATGILALTELIEDFRRDKTRVVLCELRPNVRQKLERAGVLEKLGAENLYPTLGAVFGTPAAPIDQTSSSASRSTSS
ncbi:sodium-independent anion transporter [Denitratisoma sp. DHT3]|uniref:SulP family inorganic anion transporter n=1 Tax=Denitratisoma sp. DHT3 TaxID=1981880 RepID=UPI0011984CAC|nr:SulP family inorganic anion transporter [Denitratisoma sp. DHT3]QDX82690.1 sodium-independent anion transporter [Denitratisoma sp. DHT3]